MPRFLSLLTSVIGAGSLLFSCDTKNQLKIENKINLLKTGDSVYFEDSPVFLSSWDTSTTFIQQIAQDPVSLHPAISESAIGEEIFSKTQLYLLTYDFRTNKPIPQLAKKLPQSTDEQLGLIYEIGKNYYWDDGEAVSVEDVIFTLKANCCELTNNKSIQFLLQNIDSILKINSERFKIKFKKNHFLNFEISYSLPILQKSKMDPLSLLDNYSVHELQDISRIVKRRGVETLGNWAKEFNSEKYGTEIKYLNGAGDFYIQSWEKNHQLTLIRKKNRSNSLKHSKKRPPQKIIYLINKDPLAYSLLFKNQKIDFSSYLDTKTLIELSKSPDFLENYNYAFLQTLGYTYLAFNCKPSKERNPIFTDKETRKAIANLLPYDLLNKVVYQNKNSRAIGPVSKFKKEHNEELKISEQNQQAAEELLKKAGWKDENRDRILEKKTNKKTINFQFELAYYNTSPVWREIALLIKNELKKYKIEVNLYNSDPVNLINELKQHKFDAFLGAKSESFLSEDFYSSWHSEQWKKKESNYTGFGNEYTDSLIEKLQHKIDESERIKISKLIQSEIVNETPMVFLFNSMRRIVIHKRWGGQLLYQEKPFINTRDLYLIYKAQK